jgi:hypothetical protein
MLRVRANGVPFSERHQFIQEHASGYGFILSGRIWFAAPGVALSPSYERPSTQGLHQVGSASFDLGIIPLECLKLFAKNARRILK